MLSMSRTGTLRSKMLAEEKGKQMLSTGSASAVTIEDVDVDMGSIRASRHRNRANSVFVSGNNKAVQSIIQSTAEQTENFSGRTFEPRYV